MTSAAVRPVVAFQGEHGAFSEDAACAMLGAEIELRPYSTLPAVFQAVESGEVECAVVPIENSLGGSINQTYDLLLKHSLVVGNEYGLRVRHCLMALPGTKEDAIKRVYSHPQALAQCERYLELHPGWEIHALYDTAGSARMIAREKLEGAAAVACSRAAGVYGLEILAEGIEDNTQNYTRFIQIRREPVVWASGSRGGAPGSKIPARPAADPAVDESLRPEGEPAGRSERDKTSIVFGAKNTPGALFKSLAVFAIRDINLTKLESRPSKDAPWQYVFYLDFDGNAADEPCARALTHLEEISHFVKLLGSYPRSC